MNRRYALWYHEWKTMRWFFLCGFLSVIAMSTVLQADLVAQESWIYEPFTMDSFDSHLGVDGCGSMFSLALMEVIKSGLYIAIAIFAIMSVFHFHSKQSKREREYIASLPYTKKEQFRVKVVMGYGVILVFWVAVTIAVLWLRNDFIDMLEKRNLITPDATAIMSNETVGHTLSMLLLFGIILFSLYSIFMLMQVVVNQGIMASIFSVLAIFAVSGWAAAVLRIIEKVTNSVITLVDMPMFDRDGFYGKLVGIKDIISSAIGKWDMVEGGTGYGNGEVYYYVVTHDNLWILIGIFSVIFILCSLLSWLAWRKDDEAKAGLLVSGTIKHFGISIVAGTGSALLVSSYFLDWLIGSLFIKYAVTSILFTILFWYVLKRRVR